MESNFFMLAEEVFGWMGTVAYLLAYLLLTLGKMKASQLSYQLLNLLGAVGLTVYSGVLNDLPNLVVNLVWGIIASVALVSILRNRYLARRKSKQE